MKADHSKYHFPWRDGNRFRLLIDGGQFYPAMLDAIDAAHSHIFMELYLFESGTVASRFIDRLIAARARGVEVYLLLDDYGAKKLLKEDRQTLEENDIRVSYYNPLRYHGWHHNLFRDHRKLLLVDDRIAFTGGAGITDEFDPVQNPGQHWRETMIEIRGPNAADWRILFEESWRRCGGQPLPIAKEEETAGVQHGRVTLAHGTARTEIKRSLLQRIRHARKTIWIATAYFVPSWKIRRALGTAARRGVDVRLLLPGPHTDHPAIRHAGRRFYYGLLRHGVKIFEYQPRFTHSKVLLCDDWSAIGSSNLDRWNFHWNLEANQEVDDAGFTTGVRAMFMTDFAASREYHVAEWRMRPWYRRVLEWFWGRVDIALERLSIRHAREPDRKKGTSHQR